MPSCVLKSCRNRSTIKKKDSDVTYHRFPRPGEDKREAWIRFVQKNRNEDTWLPSDHTLICSDHFKDEDKYITKTGRRYLKKCAVPYDGSDSKSGTSEFADPMSEPVSDSESIFDTPQIIVLKSKLRKATTAKKVLTAKFKKIQRQNRYLKKKCAYLQIKCASYKSMVIREMTSNFGFDAQTENDLTNRVEIVELEK